MESINHRIEGVIGIGLTERCFDFARDKGADLVGAAPVESFAGDSSSEAHPGYYVEGADSVLVMGIKVVDAIWDKLTGKYDVHSLNLHSYLMFYNYDLLDFIAIQTARFLEEEGYYAYPIQARTVTKRNKVFTGYFPFKEAAVKAGLGSIGKNTLLITPEYGPRVRLVAVITDAPLHSREGISQSPEAPGKVCGDCSICLEACPVGALYLDEEGEPRIDQARCQTQMDYCQCALCQGICKVGRIQARKRHV